MNKGKVLIAAPVHPVLTEGLQAAGYELVEVPKITQATAAGLIANCVGVVTSTRLQLDRALIDAAPGLRWIGRMGSGMEVIDLPYAASKGIACFSSPEGNCNAVAEHALGMLLSLNKRISWSGQEIREGYWRREENRGTELEGKSLGIIGFGHTGRAFARKLQGMDMQVLVYDKYRMEGLPPYVVPCPELERLQAAADIISFHVPIATDTRHYFNDLFMAQMAQPFVLINTSRGEVVDGAALERGINSGRIRGACLDVWEEEPLERMGTEQRQRLERLVQLPQVVLTPHIAGYTHEALYKMSDSLLRKIVI